MERQEPRWERLGGGLCVRVSSLHSFGADTILLSDFSRPKPRETHAVELCAGCGALSLLWCRGRERALFVDAVELQRDAWELISQSVKKNGLTHCYRPLHADVRDLRGLLPAGGYDLVACNPPYQPLGSGALNPQAAQAMVRHETQCTVDDVARAAVRLLRYGGRLCLCQRCERLADVLEACRRNSLEPKRLRFVQQRPDKPPKLFLLEARRGGRPGLRVEPVLFVEDGAGGWSDEMRRIYGDDVQKEGWK